MSPVLQGAPYIQTQKIPHELIMNAMLFLQVLKLVKLTGHSDISWRCRSVRSITPTQPDPFLICLTLTHVHKKHIHSLFTFTLAHQQHQPNLSLHTCIHTSILSEQTHSQSRAGMCWQKLGWGSCCSEVCTIDLRRDNGTFHSTEIRFYTVRAAALITVTFTLNKILILHCLYSSL